MDLLTNKQYCLITYGCQMNASDSERYAGQLEELGYTMTEDAELADVILMNTCCVRETAEDKVLGKIGEFKHLKARNNDLIIAVTGCMAQEWQERLFKRAPHLDLVIGTHNIHKLIDLIKEREEKRGHALATDMDGNVFYDIPTRRFQKFFAWVPIMNGCNKFCTYCIVPYVRGREVSRPLEEIVEEVRNLADEGYKEITLLGQNVNSYGLDFKDGTDFSALLYAEHYPELIEYVREKIPDVVLTTDLIVGFPGETEGMFQDTLKLLKKVRYDMAYTFIYSPRTGTPAATMGNQVPQEVKSDRLRRLMAVQNEISLACNKEMEGRDYEVIVEGPTKNDENHWFGRTSGNKMIIWENDGTLAVGDTVPVHVDKGQTWVLKGHTLKQEAYIG